MLDEDYGDITDPITGRDIKVVCSKQPGKRWAMTEVRPRGKESKLSPNDSQTKEWLSSIPSVGDLYQCKSYDELSKIVNDWINEGESTFDTDTVSETSESSTSSSEPESSTGYKNIDDAFADLMSD